MPATVMTLRPASTLTMALGRAYGCSTFSISTAETYCSGTTRVSKPRAPVAVPVRAGTAPLATAASAGTML